VSRQVAPAAIALALLASPAAAAGPAAPRLTLDGIGGLRIGMTLQEMQQVVGPLDIGYLDGPECGEGQPKRPWIPGVSFMVENGRLTRVDVDQGKPPAPRVRTQTEAGVGIGSTIAEVKRAYGKHLRIEPHPYDNEDGRYLVIKGLKPGREIIFEAFHGRVDSFRAGKSRSVEYIEGCA
jgi:hypothetical protein